MSTFQVLTLLLVFFLGDEWGNFTAPDAPTPPGGTPAPVTPAPVPSVPSPKIPPPPPAPKATSYEAARLLNQASFGITETDINNVRSLGLERWIDQQLTRSPTSHLSYYRSRAASMPADILNSSYERRKIRLEAWWNASLKGNDQLRQRVAFALSEIMVVSDKGALHHWTEPMADWMDMLARNAFGNFRTLLEEVTLKPVMGAYLSMRGNRKANSTGTIRPDENYAREVMQLFTIGLVELNMDGSEKLDSDSRPIPTYTQDDIESYSRVYTGWNYAGRTTSTWWQAPTPQEQLMLMTPVEAYHDTDEKHLLGGVVVPAGQTANEDLAQALDSLFNHPNVAPFICKQLIQKLVTSNPSPAYIADISAVFNDNGRGVRGDMGAVVKALLMHNEAREGHTASPTTFGKLREPILQATHIWRAFSAYSPNGRHQYYYTDSSFNQTPVGSPSVFNFFSPFYSPPGELQSAGLVGPEFQIITENKSIALNNFFYYNALQSREDTSGARDTDNLLRLTKEIALLDKPEELVERLNLLLMAGQMPTVMKDLLVAEFSTSDFERLSDYQKVANLIFLISNTPQYAIQK